VADPGDRTRTRKVFDAAAGFVFGVAVRAYPRWIRRDYAGDMQRAFAHGLAEAWRGGGRRASAWAARAIADAIGGGLDERRKGAPGAPNGTGTGGGAMLGSEIWTDVKVAARWLMRSPGFTLAAVALLALGIGANTAIFTAVRGALLAPPPFEEPDRLVLLDLTDASAQLDGRDRTMPWSYPKFRILAEAEGLPLTAVAGFAVRTLTLTGAGDATVLSAEVVTPRYFSILGVDAVAGRDFLAEDDSDGAAPVVVLSNALWRDRFGSDPETIGRSVVLNGTPAFVIGVAPAGFRGVSGGGDAWVTPHGAATLISPVMVRGAQAHWMRAVGRLTEGATLPALDERMGAVGRAVMAAYPPARPSEIQSAAGQWLTEARTNPQARSSLLVLSAAAGLLLVIACANLAGLLLARSASRRREAAVRAALGAGGWRVARGVLVESLLLALFGGVAAVAVAHVGSALLVEAWPSRFLSGDWNVRFVDLSTIGVDRPALLFAGGVSLLAGGLLGVLPALAVAGVRPAATLRESGIGRVRRRGPLEVRGALVAAEMALALMLVVGAGLLMRSLHQLQAVERGYEPGELLTFQAQAPRGSAWSDDPAGFHALVEERLAALAQIEAVGMGCVAPLSGHCMITEVRQAGDRRYEPGSGPSVGVHYVSDGYFRALGVASRAGRTFDSRDRSGSPPVVVLSERAAAELFPGEDPLGRPMAMGTALTADGATAEVIGVVPDVLYDRPENGVMAEAYVSHRQDASYGTFLVRTRGDALSAVPAIRAAVAGLDPDVPLFRLRTLDDIEASAVSETRALGGLLAIFAGLALLLACTGVWAAVAWAVAQRTREIGVRMALGARPGRVVRELVSDGLRVTLAGAALGTAAAWWASRILASLLFEVGPTDPATFVGGAALLVTVALMATWLPARRATRVDPAAALAEA
jgi:putative ABC transport system permease protein